MWIAPQSTILAGGFVLEQVSACAGLRHACDELVVIVG